MTQSTQIQTQNSKAIVSLVSGIVAWLINLVFIPVTVATMGTWLLCCAPLCSLPFIGWLVAIITGHLSLGEIKRSGQAGHGMAVTGLVLGYTGIGLSILMSIVLGVLLAMGVSISFASLPFLKDLFNQLNQYQWYIPYH